LPINEQAADGHGFLADVKMEKTTNLLGLVGAQTPFLETTDAHHHAKQLHALLLRKDGIDGRLAMPAWFAGACGVFGHGRGSRFFAHGEAQVEW
jgi:hypothetical protein